MYLIRSADLLIMLILGGTGRLYGALIGTALFMLVQDYLSALNPAYWQFGIGILLIVVVMFGQGGIMGGVAKLKRDRSAGQVFSSRKAS